MSVKKVIEKFLQLVSLKLSREASENELLELKSLMETNEELKRFYWMLEAYWNSEKRHLSEAEKALLSDRFEKIMKNARCGMEEEESVIVAVPKTKVRFWRITSLVAATVLFFAGLFFVLKKYVSPELSTDGVTEVVAEAGVRKHIVLPDSTVVWLNSNSKISFGHDFNVKERTVWIEGEAYFDVARNPAKPFIVHAATIDVNVLGTAFNIKAYSKDSLVETTVIRGHVKITEGKNFSMDLLSYEKAVYNKHTHRGGQKVRVDKLEERARVLGANIISRQDSITLETAWVYDKLVFEGDDFVEIANKMERWYNVRILIENESLKKIKLRGSFEKETVSEALDALKLIKTFQYIINKDTIIIK